MKTLVGLSYLTATVILGTLGSVNLLYPLLHDALGIPLWITFVLMVAVSFGFGKLAGRLYFWSQDINVPH